MEGHGPASTSNTFKRTKLKRQKTKKASALISPIYICILFEALPPHERLYFDRCTLNRRTAEPMRHQTLLLLVVSVVTTCCCASDVHSSPGPTLIRRQPRVYIPRNFSEIIRTNEPPRHVLRMLTSAGDRSVPQPPTGVTLRTAFNKTPRFLHTSMYVPNVHNNLAEDNPQHVQVCKIGRHNRSPSPTAG